MANGQHSGRFFPSQKAVSKTAKKTKKIGAGTLIQDWILRNSERIAAVGTLIIEHMTRDLAQKIYDHTSYSGDRPRNEVDWETAEKMVREGISRETMLETTLITVILRANQIQTGQGVPSEIVWRMDYWKYRQLKPIVDFLNTLPKENLDKLIVQATEEILPDEKRPHGDTFFLDLTTGRLVWNRCFLDWVRERPHGARGGECGIHVPVPSCYEVVCCP